jgi:hypothetical protein
MISRKISICVATLLATLLTTQFATANVSTHVMPAQKSLVIIDSGINTDLPWAKNAVVDEACFVEFHRCPNGFSQMIGTGASKMTPAMTTAGSLSHGTQMASVAVAVDPNVKIVSIRITGMTPKGVPTPYSGKAISWALDYVEGNKARLNVGAVSISLGNSYRSTACPIVGNLQKQITDLMASGVAVAIAVGNGGSTKIDYPACIPQAIAVGATEDRYAMKEVSGWVYPIMAISNHNSEVDYFVNGKYTVSDLSDNKKVSFGTSNSTVAFATYLTKRLSVGENLTAVLDSVNAALVKAYKTTTLFYPKQFNLSNP